MRTRSISTAGAGLAERLRVLVEQAGSQRSLAVKSGLSPNVVNGWMAGHSARPKNLRAVARAMGVSPEWLISGGGEMSDRIAQLAASIRRAVEDPNLTLQGRVVQTVERVLEQHASAIATDTVAENGVADALRDLLAKVPPLMEVFAYNAVARELETFEWKVRQTVASGQQALRERFPTKSDMVRRLLPAATYYGWCALELELATLLLEPDEKVIGIDAVSLTTDRRGLSRRQIREDARPVTFTDLDRWFGQFPEIKSPAEEISE